MFEDYTVQSAAANNTINLEVPLEPLLRALKSASNATSVSIRLTKKDSTPWLVLTIVTTATSHAPNPAHAVAGTGYPPLRQDDSFPDSNNLPENTHMHNPHVGELPPRRERETLITLDVPVIVLAASQVAGLHEPHCREPDVHIYLPPLSQLKSVSDRFARLAGASGSLVSAETLIRGRGGGGGAKNPKLDLAATMHGTLRLSYRSDALKISSSWRGLENPDLDPAVVGGDDSLRNHPSTRMRAIVPDEDDDESEGWAKVRIDARDWSKVLSVGRVGGRVIACELLAPLRKFWPEGLLASGVFADTL